LLIDKKSISKKYLIEPKQEQLSIFGEEQLEDYKSICKK
jgi:hypothetical protein